VSDEAAGQAPGVQQDVSSGGNSYVAGRDIIQHPNWPSDDSALEQLSASGGAKRLAALAAADETLERAGRLITG
jgi:hypothetical protein